MLKFSFLTVLYNYDAEKHQSQMIGSSKLLNPISQAV